MNLTQVSVGHFERESTGCTIFLFEKASTCAYHILGLAPATRDIAVLDPGRLLARVDAVLFSGGSAFGLGAANGVMDWLAEQNIGLATPAGSVPIVPAAAIYDLKQGVAPPAPEDARAACEAAVKGSRKTGRVGAGRGATINKLFADAEPQPGGFGHALCVLKSGLIIEAFAVVNCVGDVVDENGGIVLGGKNSCEARLLQGESPALSLRQNTSLVMITTNADLDHAACLRVARMGSAGLSRSQRPSSTTFDGDIVFAASTGNVKADDMVVGSIAQSLVAKAVLSGVVR